MPRKITPRQPRIDRTCQHCGVPFTAPPSIIRRGGGKFCSRICANSGRNNRRWNGGRWVGPDGYMLVTVAGRGRVKEHRYVMEQILGRLLRADEVVHHRNHVITDNRPENLQIMTHSDHARYHRLWEAAQLRTGLEC